MQPAFFFIQQLSIMSHRINVQNIDPCTDDIVDNIDPYRVERHYIANRNKVPIQSVDFRWHSSIGETVIYVNNVYHGYVSDIWDDVLI